MDNVIDFEIPVYNVLKKNPEISPLLVEAGFKPLMDQKMLQSVGRLVSLNQGIRKINILADDLVNTLEWNGYEVKGVEKR
ncbi:DUF1858 domain-containing protein [Alkalibacterium kapii]|uniref:DUF1858 domain-containing protein n=1 Tax=Alkalibacterium kapii TaxID=426704 RepID=A0A511AWY6_9LACT|nr:DUF1858 domain-containing protein [Alkalibacterium kapii]GEK91843.1 hypothetical protein AKA01nite_14650 [Alkalibacterium kapii]